MRSSSLALLGVLCPAYYQPRSPSPSSPPFKIHTPSPRDSAPADRHAAAPEIRAARVQGTITVDGRLDESSWAGAEPASDFTQTEPAEGQPATERTEVRVLIGDDALYVGARLHDREPQQDQGGARSPGRRGRGRRVRRLPGHLPRSPERRALPGDARWCHSGRNPRLLGSGQRGRPLLGPGMGERDPGGLAGLDRRDPDPALAAPLQLHGGRHLGDPVLSQGPPEGRGGLVCLRAQERGRGGQPVRAPGRARPAAGPAAAGAGALPARAGLV